MSDVIRAGKKKLIGRRLIALLDDQLRWLRKTAQYHGNRQFFYDHVVVAHLIAFFNPTVDSLRTIEDVFEHRRVRRLTGLPRVPKSTLSDAQQLFEPSLLQPIVDRLVKRLGDLPHESKLDSLTRQIIAVDASFFEVASRIAWALPHNRSSARGSVQLCLHLDVLHGAPDGFTVVGGGTSERTELPKAIQGGRLYLLDRAYQSYWHLDQIVELDSDFVVRLRGTANFTVLHERRLSADDRRAGVQLDAQVTPRDRRYRFSVPVRLIEITGEDGGEPVRLLTNRLDLPASLIGLLYRHRWQIELFFRWLKCVVKQRHFVSESANGMAIQLYVAMIGTLLIAMENGSRPSKYDYAQMCLAVNGLITLDEARKVTAKRREERARAAQKQAAYRKRQQQKR